MNTKKWRAKKGQYYFHVGSQGRVASDYEGNYRIDDELYEVGNYFKTEKEAQYVADKFIEMLKMVTK